MCLLLKPVLCVGLISSLFSEYGFDCAAGKMSEEEKARRRSEMMGNAGELEQHRTSRLAASYESTLEDGKLHLQVCLLFLPSYFYILYPVISYFSLLSSQQ